MAEKSEEIRQFILDTVRFNPNTLIQRTAEQFDLNRRAAGYHVRKLVNDGTLAAYGATKARRYTLRELKRESLLLDIHPGLEEHIPWIQTFEPLLEGIPENVIAICMHGFTEILNNAIDHSESDDVFMRCVITTTDIEIAIADSGIGIFKKVATSLGLEHPHQALLELAKGRFTTDPKRHSGEGIFFTSRMFDRFSIRSGELMFFHEQPEDDWLFEHDNNRLENEPGTDVFMIITKDSTRKIDEVFSRYAAPDEYSFSATQVPVTLAQFGEENLVSRSQAKRVLARVDRFEKVDLDFKGVPRIGQAFADEIFRVFADAHPDVEFTVSNASEQVTNMMRRAQSARNTAT